MKQFTGVLRHEFNMSIRRPTLWIGYGLLFVFYAVVFFAPDIYDIYTENSSAAIWRYAAQDVFMFNMFMALLSGILASDRMQRDTRLHLRELQESAPLSHSAYILSKYIGVLLSVSLPMLLWVIFYNSVITIGMGIAPLAMLPASLVTYATIALPSQAFVVAFSLACPMFMPVRVYQILFTGYWFWGNYLTPQAFPTISDTILSACGKYAMEGFFRTSPSINTVVEITPLEAVLNITVLAMLAALILFAAERSFARQARHA
jgi:hypothetical protein